MPLDEDGIGSDGSSVCMENRDIFFFGGSGADDDEDAVPFAAG